MSEPTLHERVARAMKKTWSAGALNSYEEILAALKAKYPTEAEMMAQVKGLENAMKVMGCATLDYSFLQDAESRDCPRCERSMGVRETANGICDDCGGEHGLSKAVS